MPSQSWQLKCIEWMLPLPKRQLLPMRGHPVNFGNCVWFSSQGNPKGLIKLMSLMLVPLALKMRRFFRFHWW